MDVARAGLLRLSAALRNDWEGVELAASEREAKGRTKWRCGLFLVVGSKGAVAKLLADPFVADHDLSANAASGECVAFPAPALDARFELGFWDAFSSGLQQGVEGALLCVGASGARARARSLRFFG